MNKKYLKIFRKTAVPFLIIVFFGSASLQAQSSESELEKVKVEPQEKISGENESSGADKESSGADEESNAADKESGSADEESNAADEESGGVDEESGGVDEESNAADNEIVPVASFIKTGEIQYAFGLSLSRLNSNGSLPDIGESRLEQSNEVFDVVAPAISFGGSYFFNERQGLFLGASYGNYERKLGSITCTLINASNTVSAANCDVDEKISNYNLYGAWLYRHLIDPQSVIHGRIGVAYHSITRIQELSFLSETSIEAENFSTGSFGLLLGASYQFVESIKFGFLYFPSFGESDSVPVGKFDRFDLTFSLLFT